MKIPQCCCSKVRSQDVPHHRQAIQDLTAAAGALAVRYWAIRRGNLYYNLLVYSILDYPIISHDIINIILYSRLKF